MGKISLGDPPTHLHRDFFTLILLEFGGILSRTTLDLLRHNPIMDWFEYTILFLQIYVFEPPFLPIFRHNFCNLLEISLNDFDSSKKL